MDFPVNGDFFLLQIKSPVISFKAPVQMNCGAYISPNCPPTLIMAQANIDSAISLLAPYVLPLTPKERHDVPKMGNKTLSFVEKALEYARRYPQLCPSYLNIKDFDIDMA
ncbi:MAG: hypothetical protein LBP64_10925, partial [Tannerella sp.]|nr:hypothetical protein [Tannerella sp.]